MIPPKTVLRLVRSEQARNEYERMVCQVLSEKGSLSAAELVRQVAEKMYSDELRHGAWVVDIGILGPAVFEPEAQELLEPMLGRCIEVESGSNQDFR